MDTIFDLSAAPHLPLSLRTATPPAIRPEFVLLALTDAARSSLKLRVYEYKGEIYIDTAGTA